jgi:hypothetical protein
MEIKKVKIELIREVEDNPRIISEKSLKDLEKSMDNFGYIEPILWNENTGRIVSGHQRFKILKAKGLKEIEVIPIKLSEDKEKVALLALNRIGGEFDPDKLSEFISNIDNIELSGFSEQELKEINLDYDYEDLSNEFEDLQTEENEVSIWTAKFKSQEDLNKCQKIMNKIKSENKLGGFSSDYCNGLILKKLCEKYEKN